MFIGRHVIIYVLSADWYGSFGGRRAAAFSAVGPTLARSAAFENISGVYFYATMVSAIPLYASALQRSNALGEFVVRIPFKAQAIVLAIAVFAVNAILLGAIAEVITHIQG